MNRLFYGDNLDIMRSEISDEIADLVYLDPPFKSDLNYNILFKTDGLGPDEAQLTAFKDTWRWDEAAVKAFDEVQNIPNPRLVNLVNALQGGMERTPMLAYLVNMAVRLVEIRKILKPDGSIYLHCDPTASHYLKMLMDTIFGPASFRNEIIWRRTGSHNKAQRWAPIHDVILFYTKTDQYQWNNPRRPYMKGHVDAHFVPDGKGGYRTDYYGNVLTGSGTRDGESGKPWKGFDPTAKGRHWAIPGKIWDEVGVDPSALGQHEKLDLLYKRGFITIEKGAAWPMYQRAILPDDGPAASDLWTFQPYTKGTVFGTGDGIDEDVRWLDPQDAERLGYPTQKPVALLTRIIEASSKKGDVVFDPFAGCGTTIAAADALKRRWIGIDISPFAIELIRRQRIPHLTEGKDYTVDGLPTTFDGAVMMVERDKRAFEVWCVAAVDGIPNDKKGADKGIDGRIPFKPDGKTTKFAVVSVKGGKLKADDIRALIAVAKREQAASLGFGILITLASATSGMKADAASAGMVTYNAKTYPLVQILSVEEMLKGARPRLPLVDPTVGYKKGSGVAPRQRQLL